MRRDRGRGDDQGNVDETIKGMLMRRDRGRGDDQGNVDEMRQGEGGRSREC